MLDVLDLVCLKLEYAGLLGIRECRILNYTYFAAPSRFHFSQLLNQPSRIIFVHHENILLLRSEVDLLKLCYFPEIEDRIVFVSDG